MNVIQFILVAIAVCIVIAGIYLVVRSSRRLDSAKIEAVSYDKNGIPIIPRHERNIVDDPDLDDAMAGETTIAPDREYLHAVVDDEKPSKSTAKKSKPLFNKSKSKDSDDEQLARWQAEEAQADDAEFEQLAKAYQNDEGNDAFSSLMSATDNLMPVIDTAAESEFTAQSPILDQHLLESGDIAQDEPLYSAQDNINITILPHSEANRSATIIRGRDLLALVEKYGLKFGAMNMFHRYENKDGTGKLWFSMMGTNDNGIVPFDPHNVAMNTYTGLVVFLSLPNPVALMGFDSMMSIAALMAKDLNAEVLDDNNNPVTLETKQQLRNFVRDYDDQY
ncbi:cell division protein ZipA [Psychrobacter ciconiae]|uniref:cell division protein ZipA C-terminal FtsZ-binding domain-containing protein n=1 Tax=Psychrobacter ciconiae TaxID=1553449 RepID=UPI00191B40AE|nr:cell division protein ZipA C-terminal FtsZ-binding domain-containing protein [Psychrobacter ciconiae]